MIIENTYYKLEIKLQTNLSTIPTMTYKHIEEQYITNVENSTYSIETATGSRDGDIITYTIPFIQYNVGDELKDFVCTLTGTIDLYNLDNGLNIFVDGVDTNVIKVENGATVTDDNGYVKIRPLNDSQFALIFDDTNIHTVQAIYVGNNSIATTLSNKEIIIPKIREEHEQHPEIEGSWKIEFTKFKEEMNYLDDIDWEIQLTKGGIGVANEVIQLDTPVATWTFVTGTNGYVYRKINRNTVINNNPSITTARNFKVGEYTIIARYHYYNPTTDAFEEAICYDTRPLKIKKSTPNMQVVNYAQRKNGRAVFKLTDPMGFNLENMKIVAIVNGRTYTKTTDNQGNITFNIGVKGNVKYTFKFAGNNNYNSKSWTFTETIS